MGFDLKRNVEYSEEILDKAQRRYSGNIVMASSFGSLSAGPLHFVNNFYSSNNLNGIPVINVKNKKETRETSKHRKNLMQLLDFPELIIEPEGESKINSFGKLIKKTGARAVITGVRRDESLLREDFDYLEWDGKFGVVRVHPFLDWTEEEMIGYVEKNKLPFNLNHYDPNKGRLQNKECGIHYFS
ncbi:MAG: phosphoadenosine phosphosulfate reductase family protein [Candidatus Pacearchaeota archaeon]